MRNEASAAREKNSDCQAGLRAGERAVAVRPRQQKRVPNGPTPSLVAFEVVK